MNYITIKKATIIVAVVKALEHGQETIVETILPSDKEMSAMTDEDEPLWIEKNNAKMQRICDCLNACDGYENPLDLRTQRNKLLDAAKQAQGYFLSTETGYQLLEAALKG